MKPELYGDRRMEDTIIDSITNVLWIIVGVLALVAVVLCFIGIISTPVSPTPPNYHPDYTPFFFL